VKAVIGIADAVHPDLDPALLTETTTVTENLFVMKMTKTVIEIVTATAIVIETEIEDKNLILMMIEIVGLRLRHLQDLPGKTGTKSIEVAMKIQKLQKSGRLLVEMVVVWLDLEAELATEILAQRPPCQLLN